MRPGNGKGVLPAASSAVVEDSVTAATAASGVGTLTGDGSKVSGGGMAVKKRVAPGSVAAVALVSQRLAGQALKIRATTEWVRVEGRKG